LRCHHDDACGNRANDRRARNAPSHPQRGPHLTFPSASTTASNVFAHTREQRVAIGALARARRS
jgi:hypothetical protein